MTFLNTIFVSGGTSQKRTWTKVTNLNHSKFHFDPFYIPFGVHLVAVYQSKAEKQKNLLINSIFAVDFVFRWYWQFFRFFFSEIPKKMKLPSVHFLHSFYETYLNHSKIEVSINSFCQKSIFRKVSNIPSNRVIFKLSFDMLQSNELQMEYKKDQNATSTYFWVVQVRFWLVPGTIP